MAATSHRNGSVPYIQNQLQFNLDVPPTLSHLAVRYRKPEAIVVEKLGGKSEKRRPNFVEHAVPSFQFSAVSEDKLSMAIQLARRDLRKKRIDDEEQQIEEEARELEKSKKKTPRGKGSKVKSKPKDVKSRFREVERNQNPKAKEVQTDSHRRDKKPKQKKPVFLPSGGVILKATDLLLPDRSDSPPTRDTDDYLTPAPMSQDERNAKEIKRLRQELGNYVKQIKHMEQSARTGSPSVEIQKEFEQPEEKKKRKVRNEERATRSARMLYVLQQQVREIQEELSKLEPGKSGGVKKTQTINRLAAAHRGAVRALQTFINHLPESDIRQGLPRIYHELTLLIRQLSECCSQLQIGGETGVPDIVNLISKGYYDDWQRQPKSSPRTKKAHDDLDLVSNLCDRKRKTSSRDKPRSRGFTVPQRSRRAQNPAKNSQEEAVERLCKELRNHEKKATPNRESTLKAGIDALLRAAGSPGKPVSPRQREVVVQRKVPPLPLHPPKSVLIPSRIQKERSGGLQMTVGEPHYSEPTFASQLKNVDQDEKTARNDSPRRSPSPVCPRSPHSARKKLAPRSPAVSARRYTPRADLLGKLNLGVPNEWVREAERAIHAKLKPLLDRADEISAAVSDLEKAKLSLRQKLSEKTTEKVEMNADVLADMILNDLLHDTAVEMTKLESEREAEVGAMAMQDGVPLEVMWQRMADMEKEQNEIRRRWNSVTYADTGADNLRPQMDAGCSETPGTPPPIHLTRGDEDDSSEREYQDQARPQAQFDPSGPIVFTKDRKQRHVKDENLRFGRPLGGLESEGSPRRQPLETPKIPLYIHQEDLDRIHDNRKTFESYLRRTAQDAVGTFNPAALVERIADSIMDDCFDDITDEIMETNSDIVRHEFKTEMEPTLIPTSRDKMVDAGLTQQDDDRAEEVSEEEYETEEEEEEEESGEEY
ncbi:protein moonraker-like [Lineus longissimus]|uniref:protein moonraker-like n=1 Tax=Lineus longissimus TaxID=88925 RepID=UPI002B4CD7CF